MYTFVYLSCLTETKKAKDVKTRNKESSALTVSTASLFNVYCWGKISYFIYQTQAVDKKIKATSVILPLKVKEIKDEPMDEEWKKAPQTPGGNIKDDEVLYLRLYFSLLEKSYTFVCHKINLSSNMNYHSKKFGLSKFLLFF